MTDYNVRNIENFHQTYPLLHAINEDDPDRRVECCEWFENMVRQDGEFVGNIVWSDEAQFKLNGDSVERSFSALKRMKTTLRSTQSHNKHARFSLITIEKRLLKTLKRVPFGYVIEVFNKKGRRIDLTYK
ncbi:hypothetical protein ANN_26869 [Periplaneta americana]|uniref:Transposase n=1 Tax=Periplaneta americana TaxID=6978 RepID=A0ABQ8RZK7_PERAM|nr:hypothetical protein ANN_26869 [Periplaneta americana]